MLQVSDVRRSNKFPQFGDIPLVATVLAGIAVVWWETKNELAEAAILAVTAMIPFLIAASFAEELATATILRWTLPLYGLACFAAITAQSRLRRPIEQVPRDVPRELSQLLPGMLRGLSLVVAVIPVLGLTLRRTLLACRGTATPGPIGLDWHLLTDPALSYSLPLLGLAVCCVCWAVREKRPSFFVAASLLTNLAATTAFLLPVLTTTGPVTYAILVELVQWNALAFGAVALLWQTAFWWIDGDPEDEPSALRSPFTTSFDALTPLDVQRTMAALTTAALPVLAAVAIVLSPSALPASVETLGNWMSFVALGFVAGALSIANRGSDRRRWINVGGLLGLALVPLVAAATFAANASDKWLAFHVLTGGWLALSALAAVVAIQITADKRDAAITTAASRWARLFGGMTLVLAWRGVWNDPVLPAWSIATAALLALVATTLALANRSTRDAWLATILAAMASTVAWVRLSRPYDAQALLQLAEAILATLALTAAFWQGVEIFFQRRTGSVFDVRRSLPAVHRLVPLGVLTATSLLAFWMLFLQTVAGTSTDFGDLWGLLTVLAIAIPWLLSLWDRTTTTSTAGLYALGLLGQVYLLNVFDLGVQFTLYTATMLTAVYIAATCQFWSQGQETSLPGQLLQLPRDRHLHAETSRWLPNVTSVLSSLVVVSAFWIVLTFENALVFEGFVKSVWTHGLSLRLYAVAAVAMLVPSMMHLARGTDRVNYQQAGLLLITIAAVDFGWALMTVEAGDGLSLQHAIRLMVSLAVTTTLFALILPRVIDRANDWHRRVFRAGMANGAAAVASLILVLLIEAGQFFVGVPIEATNLQIAVVALALVGLGVALVAMAVSPDLIPYDLTDRTRQLCVYGTELVLALLFFHIYLAKNDWFHGYMRPWLPYIVMAIAYVGVGLGEFFKRMNLAVLSKPVERTAIFLPLLPVLSFWALDAKGEYSQLLFVVGVMYVLLSMLRQSFVFGAVAALAGNAALWSFWVEMGEQFFSHPQLWLIPPALSVLAAAQINRKQLGEQQLTTIRYLCVTIIYVSSTGEMFLKGVMTEQLWPPMVLATLSILGIFAGIAMRVRAFLYLGASFLLMSIIAMVWHAAHALHQPWPWWTFGLVMGVVIMVIFGLFEKRRNDMHELVDGLRRWER